MTSIVRYQKFTDAWTTHALAAPVDAGCQELCTLDDGYTYVSIPDEVILPEQIPEIAATLETVTLTDALREAIKTASTHCQLIAERVIERIRAKYTVDDELYIARIAVGALQGSYVLLPGEAERIAAYQAYIEATREWARQQRATLGL